MHWLSPTPSLALPVLQPSILLQNIPPTRNKDIPHHPPKTAPDHEGTMEVDLPQEGGSGEPLARIWADRTSRRKCEDEDLLSEPGSPELSSEDENETKNGNLDHDEPVFLSDDEDPDPPVHVEISVTEQLTTDSQYCAAKAGMSPIVVVVCKACSPGSDFAFSPGAFRPG